MVVGETHHFKKPPYIMAGQPTPPPPNVPPEIAGRKKGAYFLVPLRRPY